MADHPELVITPADLLNLVPLLFALASGLMWWKVGGLTGEQTALIIVLCLVLVLVTLLARRQGFVVFRKSGEVSSPPPDLPELAPDEKVAVRATGPAERSAPLSAGRESTRSALPKPRSKPWTKIP